MLIVHVRGRGQRVEVMTVVVGWSTGSILDPLVGGEGREEAGRVRVLMLFSGSEKTKRKSFQSLYIIKRRSKGTKM